MEISWRYFVSPKVNLGTLTLIQIEVLDELQNHLDFPDRKHNENDRDFLDRWIREGISKQLIGKAEGEGLLWALDLPSNPRKRRIERGFRFGILVQVR